MEKTMAVSSVEFIPFIFLSISTVLLWLRNHPIKVLSYSWLYSFVLASASALYLELLDTAGVFVIVITALFVWLAANSNFTNSVRIISGGLFILFALALATHNMPGFKPLILMYKVNFSADSLPYSLYFNFDKTLIGLFILGLWYQRPVHLLSWSQTWLTFLKFFPMVILSVISLSLLFGYVKFEPKIVDGLWFWMWANLFFVCVAEEALFRGVIQHQLTLLLSNINHGKWIAVAAASFLFGLAHFPGGWLYVLIATVAGFGYGAIYAKTGRIEASILLHFSLNLVHILFFTYPALR